MKEGGSRIPCPWHTACPTCVPYATHGWGHCAPLPGSCWSQDPGLHLQGSQPSPCQPDLFHGYVLPSAHRHVYLKKKKKRKPRLRGRKGLPKPCEATRLTTWLKGNSPAIPQLGEMFSRRGSPTFPRFLPESMFLRGKIPREVGTGNAGWDGQPWHLPAPRPPCPTWVLTVG